MRRRRTEPEMDFVQVLQVGHATRGGDVARLKRLALETGFATVEEMQAEAKRLHPVMVARNRAKRPRHTNP